jgi:hypothetical protein
VLIDDFSEVGECAQLIGRELKIATTETAGDIRIY